MSSSTEKGGLGPGLRKIIIYSFWFFFAVGLIGSTIGILKQTTGSPPRPDLAVDALIEKAPSQLSIMVMRRDNIIYDKNLGYEGDARPAYPIAQLSDMLISLAVARLHDQERLSVDQKVTELLPDSPASLADVSVYALLTHTSGIDPNWTEIPADVTLKPAEKSEYAPLNYQLLDKIIASVTRLPSAQYIQGSVLGPMEMVHTTWDADKQSWVSTTDELRIFEQSIYKIVGLETYHKAFTVATLTDGSRGRYNFGWKAEDYKGLRMEQVVADHPDFNGILVRFPEKSFTAIVLYQGPRDEFDTHVLSKKLGTIYLEREMPFPHRKD